MKQPEYELLVAILSLKQACDEVEKILKEEELERYDWSKEKEAYPELST